MADEDYDVCRGCGANIKTKDTLCNSCKRKFELQESAIKSSDNEKYLRHCKYCGRPFAAYTWFTYKQTNNTVKRSTKKQFCNEHYAACKVCGKAVKFSGGDYIPSYCSEKCANIGRAKKSEEHFKETYGVKSAMQVPEFKANLEQANLKKYGVKCVFNVDSVRQKCEKTMDDKYGGVGYASSEIRSKSMSTCEQRYGTKDGSHTEEANEKRMKTNIERYGAENPLGSQKVRSKCAETCIEKYGVAHPIQNTKIKEKMFETMKQRYGTPYMMQNEEIKNKAWKNYKLKTGYKYPGQNPEVREKIKNTMLDKYGPEGMRSETIQTARKRTTLNKYGVEHYSQSDDFKSKFKSTSLKHYGTEHPMKSKNIADKVRKSRQLSFSDTILDIDKRENYLKFCSNPEEYIISNFDHKPSLIEISESVGGLDPTSVSEIIPKENHNLLGFYQSSMERSVCRYLDSLNLLVSYEIRDRKAICPKEIDIYFENLKFGIEVNPTYTHNSSFDQYGEPNGIPYNYHKKKCELAEANGIFIFNVFGYEWNYKQNIVQSMIANYLHANTRKIYARKCRVVEINQNVCSKFLNENHLQGSLTSPVRLALVDDKNEIVSVMTFNKMRKTMGQTKDNKNDWELSRFCSKVGANVPGGASKLFGYFKKYYNPSKVISFSDIAHTRGTLYSKLGFSLESITAPSYVWVNMHDDSFYTRVACQKRNLKSLFKDETIDVNNKTESQIMIEHGYAQVFDCGKKKWTWSN